MFHEVSGDILLTGAAAIAHGVSPNDDFHAGLALSLRERWPAMYKDFRHHCHTSHPKAGDIWAWAGVGQNGPIRIVCLFTQDEAYGHGAKPGRASTENVNHALRKLAKYLKDEKVASLALPQLATGVGGLQWSHVYPLIKSQLGDTAIPIVLYTTFHSGKQAEESALLSQTSPREAVTRHTILVPVDFSGHSRAAVRRALHLARVLDHDMALLHVVDATRPGAGTVEAARERHLALAAEADPEKSCIKILSVLEGRPHDVILHVAHTLSPRMIVMGKRGDGSIGMGSVAEKIVRGASCDVLVVREVEAPVALAPGQEE